MIYVLTVVTFLSIIYISHYYWYYLVTLHCCWCVNQSWSYTYVFVYIVLSFLSCWSWCFVCNSIYLHTNLFDQKIVTGRPAWSAAMPVLFLLSGPKIAFSPHRGATCCPNKREIWHGGTDWRYAPPCQISCLLEQNCGNTAPKTVKILYFGHKFAPRGHSFAQFLRNSQILYISIGSF